MHVTGAHPAAPSNRVGLVTGLVGTCLLVAACAAVSPALPPVADAATGLSLPGKVVWHDLITHTPDESRTFYQTLFGWDFERVGVSLGGRSDLAYWLIRHDGRLLGGMVDGRQFGDAAPEKLSQWLVVMSVADIDSATQNVRSSGGVVRRGPVDVQARGEVSVVEDVMGAEIVLLQTRDGDPPDETPAVGDFLWDEVWTDDLERTSDFYAQVAGLDAQDRSTRRGGTYRALLFDGTPRAGVLPTPLKGLPSTWTSYVRVADVRAITAQVQALGGRVLVDARERKVGGEAALIAGPSGAVIALQTWTPRQDARAADTHPATPRVAEANANEGGDP